MTSIRQSERNVREILIEETWINLSGEFKWTEELLERYADKISWDSLSSNSEMLWTQSIIDKYKDKLNWTRLSSIWNRRELYSRVNLERYEEHWDWRELSRNSALEPSLDIIEKYRDRWDWTELINNQGLISLFTLDFLERFRDKIILNYLTFSTLWREVQKEVSQLLIQEIIS